MPKLLDATRALVAITEVHDGQRITEGGKPGRFLLKIIDEGIGSSGVYPADTLQLAEADRVFAQGTHCYLDHAAALRRGPHGERSVRDLAAVLSEDAHYDPQLKALVAEADVFGAHADQLKEQAPYIGMSISASAIMGPPQPGSSRPVVRRIVEAESVDFVVRAGRGGAVLSILESQAVEATAQDRRDQLDLAVKAAYEDRPDDVWAAVRDFDDVTRIVYFYVGDAIYSEHYTPAADDLSVSLDGDRQQVRAVTTYVPVQSGGVTTTNQEAHMPEITEARLAELTESHTRVATLETERAALTKRAEEAEAKLADAAKREKVAEAKRTAAAKVAEKATSLPDLARQRVAEAIDRQIVDEALPADLDARIDAAIKAETDYIATFRESKLVGFGASADPITESAPKRTRNAFGQPIKEA